MKNDSFGVLSLFDRQIKDLESGVGYYRTYETLKHYRVVRKHLSAYIQKQYDRSEMPFGEIRHAFVIGFDTWMRKELSLSPNSVWGYMTILKHICTLARNEGLMGINPFASYVNRYTKVDRGYLNEEEISRLASVDTSSYTQELVRDLFVFSAFTGLSYIDIKGLRKENIHCLFDGNWWIVKRRQKTKVESSVRLLEVPLKLVRKWNGSATDGHLFPVPSNTCCNKTLRILTKRCGIDRRVTFHVGRHTFATLALNRGLPIESLSSILGHTNIRTTQIYAKITRKKISEDMVLLAQGISEMEKSICGSL